MGYGRLLNVQQRTPAKKITEAELKTAIYSQLDVDECESLDQINIYHVEYHDFIGDAVVMASTCMTGTAGPDIHAIYKCDADGKVVELPFLHVEGDPFFNRHGWKVPVLGNANYELAVENRELEPRWSDSSGREAPLVVWYKWDGKSFVMGHMKVEGPFPASYDCAKATNELDRTICYSPSVASLDVQLGRLTRRGCNNSHRTRNGSYKVNNANGCREKKCIIYMRWVDCLQDLDTERIAESNQR